ncbi:hypothetical protein T12_13023 [Trichinella patagoniensis]|uniref:Uncharacterized protein n=1 Tax=Trichinella patagoniensis TaxID=990121 RepID=A0A0V0ZR93_9BILA|nr:hypothetical protein T12_13023 [Trichinella patagoniensis]
MGWKGRAPGMMKPRGVVAPSAPRRQSGEKLANKPTRRAEKKKPTRFAKRTLNFGQRVDNSISGAFNLHHRLSVIFPNFLQLITANRGSPAAEACTSGWVYSSPLLASSGHLIHSSKTPCVPDLNGDTSHCAQKQATKTAVVAVLDVDQNADVEQHRCPFRQHHRPWCTNMEQHPCNLLYRQDADVPVGRDVDADKEDAVVGNEDADVDREDADVDREDAVVARDAPVDREDAVAGREGAAVDRELVDVRQSQHHYHHHHPPWYDPLRYRIV